MALTPARRTAFYFIMLMPLWGGVAWGSYLWFFTNLRPQLYLQSIRNIPFECMDFVEAAYVYTMKPGPCQFDNIEFRTVMTHDAEGFRNRHRSPQYDVTAIGDSHTQGWGVADDQTYPALLASEFGYRTRNLGIGSYATMRELETLAAHGNGSKYVVLQYCPNDFPENLKSLSLSKSDFVAAVDAEWRGRISRYNHGKAAGLWKPVRDAAVMIGSGSYTPLAKVHQMNAARSSDAEAQVFARIIDRYRPLLEGRRLIVFEADLAGTRASFEPSFSHALKAVDGISVRVLPSALEYDDYFLLDGHPTPSGHRKIAAAVGAAIRDWESSDPVLRE